MKDAKGHGSDPRGGNANRATTALDMRAEMDRQRGQAPAHQSGVNNIGSGFRTATPTEFPTARAQSSRPEMFTPHTPEELAPFKLFINPAGTVGGAVSPEGDIQSVFNNSGVKGAGGAAVEEAKARGGKTLDAFAPVLPEIYKQHGFEETGRAAFDPKLAPPAWDVKKHGTPDVVFMKLKGAK